MKTYYKVVQRLKNGDRVSLFMQKKIGLRKTYYHHGQPCLVDSGMVFDSYHHAKDFLLLESNEEIWECTILKESSHLNYSLIFDSLSYQDNKTINKTVNYFKDIINKHVIFSQDNEYIYNHTVWPLGTIFAEGIILTVKAQ